MSPQWKKVLGSFDRVRYLRRAMPLRDAVRVAFATKSTPEIRVFLKAIKRHVWLRVGTTDLKCLEKVFINDEYNSPYKLDPRLIVDAGANVGMSTLYFAHRYPQARIIAIEPEPSNSEMLRRNCTGLQNVIILQAALWPVNGPLQIENLTADAWAFSVTELPASLGGVTVKAITIADILNVPRVEQIDLLKLDIEGSELALFSTGAERWIDRVGTIVIELHDRDRPGCAKAFYSLLAGRKFIQEIRGENIFVKLLRQGN